MSALLPPCSTPTRDALLARLGEATWDLAVVGGGITGAAVARDAARRGLRVALFEQDDLASGTSSRSSRLVHGGLRYLAEFDFALVREALVERRRLLDSAPGLVRAVEFLFTVWSDSPDPLWKIRLGVRLYALLAGGYGLGGERHLRRRQVLRLVPGLRSRGMRGAVAYLDAATHDSRLTLAVALGARAAGATILTRCRVRRLGTAAGLQTLEIEDRIGARPIRLHSRAVVLCGGPWHDLVPTDRLALRTARGTHVSFSGASLPVHCFLTLRSPDDGRVAFAMPVAGYTVVGTTDTDDPTPPDRVCPAASDVDYLLHVANRAFPDAGLSRASVRGVWSGLRPLLEEPGQGDPDELSRRHRVVSLGPGRWVLAGGKLTTHRQMAEDCVDAVLAEAPPAAGPPPCDTLEGPLLAGSLEVGRERLAELGLEPAAVASLAHLYGARLERLAELVAEGDDLETAQTRLAAEEEWVLALDDLMLRRTLPGPLDLYACWRDAPAAASRLAAALGWSPSESENQARALRRHIEDDLAAAGLPAPASQPS